MARDRSSFKLALGGLAALAAAIGVGRFVYTPILPFMAESLSLTKAEAGLIASANFAGYLCGALLAASPRLSGSARRRLLFSLSVSAATTGAMGFVSGLGAMLALRFLGGAASAFVLVFASALVLERPAAAGRGDLPALHFAGVGVGIAASALVAAGLAASGVDWRGLWLAAGALSLASVPAVATLVPQQGDGPPRSALLRAIPAPPSAALIRLIAAYGLFGLGYVVTATFLVAIVRGEPGMRALEPVIWLIVGLTAAPSVALWTWIGRRTGTARAFAIACLVEAAGVLASVTAGGGGSALVSAVLLGGTFMGVTALGLVGARALSSGNPHHTLALMTAAFGVGQIVGPAAAGHVHDLTGGFGWPSFGAALALAIAAALTIGLDAERRI